MTASHPVHPDLLALTRHLTGCIARCIAALARDGDASLHAHQVALQEALESVQGTVDRLAMREPGWNRPRGNLAALGAALQRWRPASVGARPDERRLRAEFLRAADAVLADAAAHEDRVPRARVIRGRSMAMRPGAGAA
jgi:hypothetical protein